MVPKTNLHNTERVDTLFDIVQNEWQAPNGNLKLGTEDLHTALKGEIIDNPPSQYDMVPVDPSTTGPIDFTQFSPTGSAPLGQGLEESTIPFLDIAVNDSFASGNAKYAQIEVEAYLFNRHLNFRILVLDSSLKDAYSNSRLLDFTRKNLCYVFFDDFPCARLALISTYIKKVLLEKYSINLDFIPLYYNLIKTNLMTFN